ncbi:hypothetical protein PU634_10425 [Oceanimonas pelagia]|uniref:Uncharacterized protein n=1 Tax=Oceanimonas pelagia TaxID=3028314 RepID=A0AA50KM04_9GAMM|nr:hypothetical protein [Oceanimonas pelagia]WMC09531.1 hypothetical protein PU634_10425 [Oceanimonas pelagia]
MDDRQIVNTIKQVSADLGLTYHCRRLGWKFCTVALKAPANLNRVEQQTLLEKADGVLIARGLVSGQLTTHTNPEHPRHGDPFIEIDSVWWDPRWDVEEN